MRARFDRPGGQLDQSPIAVSTAHAIALWNDPDPILKGVTEPFPAGSSMRWLFGHRAREYVRRSVWIVPTAAIPLALIVAPLIRRLDDATRWRGLDFSVEGAKTLLNALPTATLTFIVLILSTLLLTVQLASSQLSP